MPDCIPCLSKGIKETLKDTVAEPELHKMIDDMPTCPAGITLNFCPVDFSAGQGTRRQHHDHQKRAPSAYNLFIKTCMSTKPIKGKPFGAAGQFMKECATEYKAQKGKSGKQTGSPQAQEAPQLTSCPRT